MTTSKTLIIMSAIAFMAASTTTVMAGGQGGKKGPSASASSFDFSTTQQGQLQGQTVNVYNDGGGMGGLGAFDSSPLPASEGGNGGGGGTGGTASSGNNYFSSDHESTVYAPVASVSSSNNTAPCQKNRSFALGAYLASFGFSTTTDSNECWDSWFAQQAMASGSSKLKNSGAELLDLSVQDRIDGLRQRIAEKRKNRGVITPSTPRPTTRIANTSDPRGAFGS